MGKHEKSGVKHTPVAHVIVLDVKPVLDELVVAAQDALDQEILYHSAQAGWQVILHL